uniref:Serine peptidase inhibitor Kazal type 14 (putative) n=1 Tax=Gorilla gorilla gorilla TaxID=9595 RepID=A0A2I2ZQM9_GORGO
MAKSFPVFSLLSFILIHLVLSSVSGPRHWWPPHGIIKEISWKNQVLP